MNKKRIFFYDINSQQYELEKQVDFIPPSVIKKIGKYYGREFNRGNDYFYGPYNMYDVHLDEWEFGRPN